MRDEFFDILKKMHSDPELQDDERSPLRITYLLWVAHHLERVADYCATISGSTSSSPKAPA